MQQNYHGLPAASSVEQAIILAQLLILKGRERLTEEWTGASLPRSPQSSLG
jgi:hypothetical protein